MFFSEIFYRVVSRLIVQFLTQLKKYKFFPSKVFCQALSKLFIYLIADFKNYYFYYLKCFFLSNPFVTLINHFEKVRFSLSIGGLEHFSHGQTVAKPKVTVALPALVLHGGGSVC
jgi:hypothetical protein